MVSYGHLHDHRVGQTIASRYCVLRAVHRNADVERFEARDIRGGRHVTVAFLSRSLVDSPAQADRFARVARIATKTQSPFVLAVLDFGRTEDDQTPFLVTELLDGVPLTEAIAAMPLDVGRVLRLGIDLARGLEALHRSSGPHLALTPASVFLTRPPGGHDEIPKIVDLGIAGLERSGTPHVAPEQVAGRIADARADVFALGVVLYTMLTKEDPFGGEGERDERVLREAPPSLRDLRPGLPDGLIETVLRCLAKSPEDRPASASVVEDALGTIELAARRTPTTSRSRNGREPSPKLETRGREPSPRSPVAGREPSEPPSQSSALPRPPGSASATLLGDEFREPRTDYPYDLAVVLERIPATATIKGLFIQAALDAGGGRGPVLARANVPERRFGAFTDFPMADYHRIVVAAAETLHPGLPRPAALRRFFRGVYRTFAETLIGKVMFGSLGEDPARIFPIGARAYGVSAKLGEVSSEALGPRHVRYVFRDYPVLIAECCDVGVVEGALESLGQPAGVVLIRTPSPEHAELDIRW